MQQSNRSGSLEYISYGIFIRCDSCNICVSDQVHACKIKFMHVNIMSSKWANLIYVENKF